MTWRRRRQTAERRSQADRCQVGKHESAVHLFFGNAQLTGIDNNRNGEGNTLVAASGINNDRHAKTGHTGIGAGSGPGLGFGF